MMEWPPAGGSLTATGGATTPFGLVVTSGVASPTPLSLPAASVACTE
jgi:hypothetical protein